VIHLVSEFYAPFLMARNDCLFKVPLLSSFCLFRFVIPSAARDLHSAAHELQIPRPSSAAPAGGSG